MSAPTAGAKSLFEITAPESADLGVFLFRPEFFKEIELFSKNLLTDRGSYGNMASVS
jgi:hypothetical protein